MADDAPVMHPNKRNFVEGLDLIFDRWVALRMAVEMEWGGPDATSKAEEFKAGLIEYFDREGKNIECEDIEDILLEVMSTEFCTLLEDGSEREVAKSIWTLFHESIKGKTVLLESLRQRAALSPVMLPRREDVTSAEDEDIEDVGKLGDDDTEMILD